MQVLQALSLWFLLSGAFAGVTIHTYKAGDGINFPQRGQIVSAHYTGTLLDGTKFDSSHDRGRPYTFRLGHGEVIRGWDEGLAQMSLGQRATMIVTSDYAYGSAGVVNVIPPDAILTFDVELLGFE